MEHLVSAGAYPNARSDTGKTILHSTRQVHVDISIVKCLLTTGADPNGRTDTGKKMVQHANVSTVGCRLDAGADQ